MQYVFYLFIVGFLFAFWLGLWKQMGSKNLEIWTNIISVLFGLAGAYFLAFSLRIKTQYSKDIAEMIGAKDKELLIPTEVSQRHKLFWWGFAFITIAALIQLYLFLSRDLI
jgi:Ca2+/Na+ antiporter